MIYWKWWYIFDSISSKKQPTINNQHYTTNNLLVFFGGSPGSRRCKGGGGFEGDSGEKGGFPGIDRGCEGVGGCGRSGRLRSRCGCRWFARSSRRTVGGYSGRSQSRGCSTRRKSRRWSGTALLALLWTKETHFLIPIFVIFLLAFLLAGRIGFTSFLLFVFETISNFVLTFTTTRVITHRRTKEFYFLILIFFIFLFAPFLGIRSDPGLTILLLFVFEFISLQIVTFPTNNRWWTGNRTRNRTRYRTGCLTRNCTRSEARCCTGITGRFATWNHTGCLTRTNTRSRAFGGTIGGSRGREETPWRWWTGMTGRFGTR